MNQTQQPTAKNTNWMNKSAIIRTFGGMPNYNKGRPTTARIFDVVKNCLGLDVNACGLLKTYRTIGNYTYSMLTDPEVTAYKPGSFNSPRTPLSVEDYLINDLESLARSIDGAQCISFFSNDKDDCSLTVTISCNHEVTRHDIPLSISVNLHFQKDGGFEEATVVIDVPAGGLDITASDAREKLVKLAEAINTLCGCAIPTSETTEWIQPELPQCVLDVDTPTRTVTYGGWALDFAVHPDVTSNTTLVHDVHLGVLSAIAQVLDASIHYRDLDFVSGDVNGTTFFTQSKRFTPPASSSLLNEVKFDRTTDFEVKVLMFDTWKRETPTLVSMAFVTESTQKRTLKIELHAENITAISESAMFKCICTLTDGESIQFSLSSGKLLADSNISGCSMDFADEVSKLIEQAIDGLYLSNLSN